MINKLVPAVGAAATLLLGGSANAAIVSGSIAGNFSGYPASADGYIASGNIPYFNTNLGVLNQITIFSYYSVDFGLSSYVVGDPGFQFPTVQVTSDPAMLYSLDNAAFQALPGQYHTITREPSSPDYGAEKTGNAYIVEVPPGVPRDQNLAGSQTLIVDPSLYAAFETSGGGVFNLSLTKDLGIHSLWTPDRGGATAYGLGAALYTRVAYSYTPFPPPPPVEAIPEPANWALMILGFCATGAALRSRRRPALAG